MIYSVLFMLFYWLEGKENSHLPREGEIQTQEGTNSFVRVMASCSIVTFNQVQKVCQETVNMTF